MIRRLLDWLDARTGYRIGLDHLLDEPLPPGTGWWFTLGSVLLFLLTVQLLTGAFLVLYYAPTPDHAYDSVRFITDQAMFGRFVRGLHYFGASFIVVFAALHLLRVVALGSFKAPRELTWLSGVGLLLFILAFGLSGYLLPWDQRAYSATAVTINIAKLTPILGNQIATIMRGGPELGALTLSRWYAVHVIFLPAVLVGLVAAHLYLMRRHGISGPTRAKSGRALPFYPDHAVRDISVVVFVAIVLGAFVSHGMPGLEPMADPSDTTYVPRPEWYFLSLFQLLKYFPGRLEIIGALIIPGLAVALLALLPWIDRGPDRNPRARKGMLALVGLGGATVAALAMLSLRDRPASAASDLNRWQPAAFAGHVWIGDAGCARCHADGGPADDLAHQPLARGAEWLTAHIATPDSILPGVVPPAKLRQAHAIAMYVARLQRGPLPPAPSEQEQTVDLVFAGWCIACHTLDGDGAHNGPDLSRIGQKHDRDWLRNWITNPKAVKPETQMPAFGSVLTRHELDAMASFLAGRR